MASGADKADRLKRSVLPAPVGGLSAALGHDKTPHPTSRARQAAQHDLARLNKNLSQQNSEIRALLESIAIPMLSLDSELRVRAFTPEIASLFAVAEADKGRPAGDLAHHLAPCDPLGDATAVLQTGSALMREVRLAKTGAVFQMHIRPTGPAWGAVDGVVLSFVDISDQKRAEERISHAGKLMALGEMASGMAHELNQPLNSIRIGLANITAKLRQGQVPPDDMAARLERVERNVQRAITVVSHILAFGRRVQEASGCFDAAVAVRDACLLAQQELQDAGITLKTIKTRASPLVSGHPSLLEQVVLNLLLNARDAILSRREGEPALQGHIEVALKATAKDLVLRVRDNGVGIGADIASRVFEPFFTTKEIGKGTGLGLSISRRIIGEMGGRISVEAVPEGSCFRINLPRAKAAPALSEVPRAYGETGGVGLS